MERRNLALLCAGVLCFWLFALAFGTAEGRGVAVQAELPTAAPAAVEDVPVVDAAAQPQLSLNCRAAILVDQDTGTVLYEKNADEQVPIASITKVMTLLLTFEAIHNGQLTLETTVPVSEHAYHMGGSQIWLEPGEQFTLDEMIKAICVSSANDAAVAVAELVGGSEPAFVERMNARAAELGMEHTTFHNACGLDTEGHLSTARDVAVMSCQILNTCPEVLHYTGIWTDTLRGGATQLVNTNKLLHRYNGITGLKTGTTGGAGVCISASAARDGLRLVAVILGAPSSKDRFEAAAALLDYGFGGWQAAAGTGGPALTIKGKGQCRGQRAAGLFRSAADRSAAPGGHGGADRAGLPAPAAGSPGGKGSDGGHRAGIPRRDSAGRIRGESGRRRAPDGLWHCLQPAVGQPDRLKNRNIRFSAQKRKRPRAQKLSA